MKLPQDKVLLFDLGGVILTIDYQATVNAFTELLKTTNLQYNQQDQSELFDRYETGEISTMHFLNLLKEQFPEEVTIYQLTQAWNAMLGTFPEENIAFLLNIKKRHRISLLSNTNDLHTAWFNRKLKELHNIALNDIFECVFLSHEIKKRKPQPETFSWVATQLKVDTTSIFFTDDSFQHIEGAKKAGLSTFLYPQNQLLKDVFTL